MTSPQPVPAAPAAKKADTTAVATALAVIVAVLILLCALVAGLAWWFGWSTERFAGPAGASWSGFADFRDWIRTGL